MSALARRRGLEYGSPRRWRVYRDLFGKDPVHVWVASSPDPFQGRSRTFFSFHGAIDYAQRMAASQSRGAVYPVGNRSTR